MAHVLPKGRQFLLDKWNPPCYCETFNWQNEQHKPYRGDLDFSINIKMMLLYSGMSNSLVLPSFFLKGNHIMTIQVKVCLSWANGFKEDFIINSCLFERSIICKFGIQSSKLQILTEKLCIYLTNHYKYILNFISSYSKFKQSLNDKMHYASARPVTKCHTFH